ncbi:MAG: iron-binding protein [Phycisphaerae bacterium]|nr:iron-binding protein [Phycisphaerae bacterium]
MARLVRHELDAPVRIDPQDKPIFVCACGISRKFPLCDGSHKNCKSEQPGKLYVYDKESGDIVEERDDA